MAGIMNSFEHFLLTRFNAPVKSGSPAPFAGADEKGLARRFDLFERVCLASVQRQTEGNFRWLVFMDWATPVPFKERMAALTVRHEFLRPVYCSAFDEEVALAEIRRLEAPGRLRITTRLDSAAAIHPRLVEKIRKLADLHAPSMDLTRGFAIGFPIGCAERNGDFYVRREEGNPFMSFVSAPECARTALAEGTSPVRVREHARPMWCQVISGEGAGSTPNGVYWPWGGNSEFAPGVTNGFCRGVLWQCAEVVSSAARYLLRR